MYSWVLLLTLTGSKQLDCCLNELLSNKCRKWWQPPNSPVFTRKRGRDRFDNKGCEKTTETLRIISFNVLRTETNKHGNNCWLNRKTTQNDNCGNIKNILFPSFGGSVLLNGSIYLSCFLNCWSKCYTTVILMFWHTELSFNFY